MSFDSSVACYCVRELMVIHYVDDFYTQPDVQRY